jgi:hypothetical protein
MAAVCFDTQKKKSEHEFRVEWVESQSSIPRSVWDTCSDSGIEGRWWYETLEQSKLGDQFRFFYAVIYDHRPIGIAPLFLMDVPIDLVAPEAVAKVFNGLGRFFPALKYQRTFSVGSPCSDEGWVGLAPGYEFSQVTAVLQKAIEAKARLLKAPMIAWKDFPEHFCPTLARLAQSNNLFKMVSFPGAVLNLPADGQLESYYKSLKASRRQKIKKKLRVSKAAVDLDLEVIQRPNSVQREEIFQLFMQTYEKGKTKFEKLNREFFAAIADKEPSWFLLQRERKSNKLVAFMLCFDLNGRVVNKFIGLDYSCPPDWFLYFRLWEEAVKWCLLKNAKELQSGQTGYSAKIELGHRLVALTNYCKHSNPIINKIFGTVAKGISWSSLDQDLAVFLKAHPGEDENPNLLEQISSTRKEQKF